MDSNFDKSDKKQGSDRLDSREGALVSGAPYWAPRELSDEYITATQKRAGFDQPFLILTLLLLLIGIVMVLSASFARGSVSGNPLRVFSRQLAFAVSGLAIMILVSRFTAKKMSRLAYLLLIFSILMLVIVLFVGIKVNGAKRWLGFKSDVGSLSFQPSEVAKLALVMAMSKWICDVGPKKMKTIRYGILPLLAICGIVVVLLMLEPHISASIIVIALTAIMMFAGGVRLRWFLIPALLVVIGFALIINIAFRNEAHDDSQPSISSQISVAQWGIGKFAYADGRVSAWLDPEESPLEQGYQVRQSLYAVGSGGFLGQGLGQSRQKYLYLPEEHNDYIFAIVCEELGFIGAILILMLFAMLVVRGFWLALHAKDRYSALITSGITSLLAIQVFLNVAVVTNLLPATGVSLPFFSYGGTALWIQLFQVGIILAVSREIPPVKRRQT